MNSDLPPLLKYLGDYGIEGTNKNIKGSDVAKLIRGYGGLVNLLHSSDMPAVLSPCNGNRNDLRKTLTHMRLKQFILNEFDLCRYGLKEGCRYAVHCSSHVNLSTINFYLLFSTT